MIVNWISKSGKNFSADVISAGTINVSADGKLIGRAIGMAPATAPHLVSLRSALAASGCTHVLQAGSTSVGVPSAAAAEIKSAIEITEANRPKSRQEVYNDLVAVYQTAKHAAEVARESAYRGDTGRGFVRAAELDAATETARLAVVAFGDYHDTETDDGDDD